MQSERRNSEFFALSAPSFLPFRPLFFFPFETFRWGVSAIDRMDDMVTKSLVVEDVGGTKPRFLCSPLPLSPSLSFFRAFDY